VLLLELADVPLIARLRPAAHFHVLGLHTFDILLPLHLPERYHEDAREVRVRDDHRVAPILILETRERVGGHEREERALLERSADNYVDYARQYREG